MESLTFMVSSTLGCGERGYCGPCRYRSDFPLSVVAVIVALPSAKAVIIPSSSTLTLEGLSQDHMTVFIGSIFGCDDGGEQFARAHI